jgi:hypothetical protein
MAPIALRHSCVGQIVSAHTVPRGSSLSRIARDGHVLAYDVSPATLNSTGGRIKLKPIGIRKASTFFGFCAAHDQELFASFERHSFSATSKQCLDIAFRAVCRELYAKRASRVLPSILKSADKGRSLIEQQVIQNVAKNHLLGIDAAIRELENCYNSIGDIISGVSASSLKSLVLEFDAEIPVLFSSGWSPSFDLHGERLQDLSDVALVAQQVWMSSLISDGKSFVCVSWIDTPNCPGEIISSQLSAFNDTDKLPTIIQIAFRFFENIFVSPDWFDQLGAMEKAKIDELAHGGLSLLGDECKVNIDHKLNFRLPIATNSIIL